MCEPHRSQWDNCKQYCRHQEHLQTTSLLKKNIYIYALFQTQGYATFLQRSKTDQGLFSKQLGFMELSGNITPLISFIWCTIYINACCKNTFEKKNWEKKLVISPFWFRKHLAQGPLLVTKGFFVQNLHLSCLICFLKKKKKVCSALVFLCSKLGRKMENASFQGMSPFLKAE